MEAFRSLYVPASFHGSLGLGGLPRTSYLASPLRRFELRGTPSVEGGEIKAISRQLSSVWFQWPVAKATIRPFVWKTSSYVRYHLTVKPHKAQGT